MGISIAHSFAQIVGSWDGALVVELAAGGEYEVPVGSDLVLSELGVLAAWPGPEPAGHFWPWGAVAGIRQVPVPAPAPAAEPSAEPPVGQASPQAQDT